MATLDQIIDAALDRDGKAPSGSTLVVANHLSQMKLFGIRKGLEVYPEQDDDWDTRAKFVKRVWKANKFDTLLDRLWDLLLCRGQLLFYLRPTRKGGYQIFFYTKDQFKVYYDDEGEINEVVIIYNYKVRDRLAGDNQKWMKLKITADVIEQIETDSKPDFDNALYEANSKKFVNTLSFIPCVVVNNYVTAYGQEGVGDFEWLRDQIETLDRMMSAVQSNLEFFGNPTLVTTRSSREVTEAILGEENPSRPTLSSNGGWYGSTKSTRKSDPFSRGDGGGVRVKKVVGNVQGDERFGYISPDPATGDHNRYISELRESIHFALGGIDELGVRASATAYEMKAIYGRLAATAGKRCVALYEHGICKVFELAIAAEEKVFKQSIATALKKDIAEISDDLIQQLIETGKLPKEVWGIPPLGDRTVKWRFTGPVFEDSPRDLLDKSIVVRNMQELGVQSLEGLKFLFDNRTEKELKTLLAGGYPFRYLNEIGASTGQLLSLYGQMMNLPDPNNPGLPLAGAIDVTPIIQSSIETIYNQLNYGKQFDNVDPSASPPPDYDDGYGGIPDPRGNTPVLQPGADTAVSNKRGTVPGSGGSGSLTDPSSPYASLIAAGIQPPGQQQLEGSVQQSSGANEQTPEFAQSIPAPGSTVNTTASAIQPVGSELQQWQSVQGSSIPADLSTGNSVWQQLFPTFTNAAKRVTKRKRK